MEANLIKTLSHVKRFNLPLIIVSVHHLHLSGMLSYLDASNVVLILLITTRAQENVQHVQINILIILILINASIKAVNQEKFTIQLQKHVKFLQKNLIKLLILYAQLISPFGIDLHYLVLDVRSIALFLMVHRKTVKHVHKIPHTIHLEISVLYSVDKVYN